MKFFELDSTWYEIDDHPNCEIGIRYLTAEDSEHKLLIELVGQEAYNTFMWSEDATVTNIQALVAAAQNHLYGYSGAAVASEYGWVPMHLADLDADFLRFYGLDYRSLDSRRFFDLASRLFAYGGVMSARLRNEELSKLDEEPIHIISNTYLTERLGK